MRPSRGMGAISPSKVPKPRTVKKRDGCEPVKLFKQGGKVKFKDGGIAPYGIRHSGEGAKGKGYFGRLPATDGRYSTEISRETDGLEYPLIVPTLTRKELNSLLRGEEPTKEIEEKAFKHAQERRKSKNGAFSSNQELRYPLPPEDEDSYKLHKSGGSVVNEAGNYTTEYASTTRAKRAGKAAGKQFVPQPPRISKKVAKHRRIG